MTMGSKLPLTRLVYDRARATPDREALISIGQGTLTWAQLWTDVLRWAGWLTEHGVGTGDRVVTLIPQSMESHLAWLGASLLRAVDVSVNTEFRGEWLRHALAVSRARVAVVSQRFLEPTLAVVQGTPVEKLLVYDGDSSIAHRAEGSVIVAGGAGEATPLDDRVPDVRLADIGCILYTSGTTGRSKAVQLPWRQLLAMCQTEPDLAHPEDQVFYLPYAPCHLSGRGALYRGALAGGRTVIREAFSATGFWSDIAEHGCTWTLLYAAPTRFLMRNPPSRRDSDNPLRRVLMCPLLREADEFRERFNVAEIYSVYGLTEAASPLVLGVGDCSSRNAGCCGVPIDGVEARIVDTDDYPVPDGQVGELVMRSDEPWLFMAGYQGDPEATARVWRNGWLHTGDIFERDTSGNYWYRDRAKDMIRRRGENISSAELEAAVLRSPAVAEAAAVGVPSELGDEEVLVAVVAAEGCEADPQQLIDGLEEIVPRFAVPRYVRIVDDLPKTQSTGRVRKDQLRTEGVTDGTWDARVATPR